MEKQFENTIRENLFKIRTERKLSQGYIGRVLYISQPAYRKMEQGATSISAAQLGVLADFYKVRLHLFYYKDMAPGMDFYLTKEQYNQLFDQQYTVSFLRDVSEKRIRELEAVVSRKDAEIAALLGKARKNNRGLLNP